MPLRGRWGGGKWHASCGPEWRLSAVAAVPLRGQSRWAHNIYTCRSATSAQPTKRPEPKAAPCEAPETSSHTRFLLCDRFRERFGSTGDFSRGAAIDVQPISDAQRVRTQVGLGFNPCQ